MLDLQSIYPYRLSIPSLRMPLLLHNATGALHAAAAAVAAWRPEDGVGRPNGEEDRSISFDPRDDREGEGGDDALDCRRGEDDDVDVDS